MIGTRQASTPKNPHLDFNFPYAVSGLCFVFLPMATSAVSRVKPNVSANIRYITRYSPPPSFAARYGNLQIFPSPTALPAAASTNPIDPENECLFFSFSMFPVGKSPLPSCKILNPLYYKQALCQSFISYPYSRNVSSSSMAMS